MFFIKFSIISKHKKTITLFCTPSPLLSRKFCTPFERKKSNLHPLPLKKGAFCTPLFFLSKYAFLHRKETADDTKRFCGFTIFVLKSSFWMVLRAFFIFMLFPCIASASIAGASIVSASIVSATHTIVQALNRSGIDIENKNALWYN